MHGGGFAETRNAHKFLQIGRIALGAKPAKGSPVFPVTVTETKGAKCEKYFSSPRSVRSPPSRAFVASWGDKLIEFPFHADREVPQHA